MVSEATPSPNYATTTPLVLNFFAFIIKLHPMTSLRMENISWLFHSFVSQNTASEHVSENRFCVRSEKVRHKEEINCAVRRPKMRLLQSLFYSRLKCFKFHSKPDCTIRT